MVHRGEVELLHRRLRQLVQRLLRGDLPPRHPVEQRCRAVPPQRRPAAARRPADRPAHRARPGARRCADRRRRSLPPRRSCSPACSCRRRSAEFGSPFTYQPRCLRNSIAAPRGRARNAGPCARARARSRTAPPPAAWPAPALPSSSARAWSKIHGWPNEPRAIMTPAQPVSCRIRKASCRRPDVAVADHRDVERLRHRGDLVPVGVARVHLRPRARMQRQHARPRVLAAQGDGDRVAHLLVPAAADLDRHRQASAAATARITCSHQIQVPQAARSPVPAHDLLHRAAEVDVDVIGLEDVGDQCRGVAHRVRIGAEDLHADRALLGARTAAWPASPGSPAGCPPPTGTRSRRRPPRAAGRGGGRATPSTPAMGARKSGTACGPTGYGKGMQEKLTGA